MLQPFQKDTELDRVLHESVVVMGEESAFAHRLFSPHVFAYLSVAPCEAPAIFGYEWMLLEGIAPVFAGRLSSSQLEELA
ncbi:MAG: hypothetical protein WC284_08905 [Candidimonas sp.]